MFGRIILCSPSFYVIKWAIVSYVAGIGFLAIFLVEIVWRKSEGRIFPNLAFSLLP